MGVDATARGGADDGADGGEQVRAPVGAEAAGDFAAGCGGPEFALAAVVVGGQFGMIEKGEQVVAHAGVSLAQSLAVAVSGRRRHDGVKVVIETAAVLAPQHRQRPAYRSTRVTTGLTFGNPILS